MQWNGVWKPRMLLPSMPSSNSLRHGQMPNDSGFGHGMCQKVRIVARGSCARTIAGSKREVVVLHQHDRVFAARLGDHRVGEALVDRLVELPVGFAEHRPHVRDVAERPQPFVGEAVVVAVFLLGRQPEPAQRVLRVPGRHHQRGRARRPPRGRRRRCRARSRCPSRRASPARSRSPARWPAGGPRRRRACARGCRARGWRRR